MPLTDKQRNLQAAKEQREYEKAARAIGRKDVAYLARQGQRQYLAAAHRNAQQTF